MDELDDWLANNPTPTKPGFPGVMDRITPEHRAMVIDAYVNRNVSGPDLRRFLAEKYPDIRFTSSNVDLWLSKNHSRNSRANV